MVLQQARRRRSRANSINEHGARLPAQRGSGLAGFQGAACCIRQEQRCTARHVGASRAGAGAGALRLRIVMIAWLHSQQLYCSTA